MRKPDTCADEDTSGKAGTYTLVFKGTIGSERGTGVAVTRLYGLPEVWQGNFSVPTMYGCIGASGDITMTFDHPPYGATLEGGMWLHNCPNCCPLGAPWPATGQCQGSQIEFSGSVEGTVSGAEMHGNHCCWVCKGDPYSRTYSATFSATRVQ